MKMIVLYQWRYYDPIRKRKFRSHLCEEPSPEWVTLERIEASREERLCPESDAELEAASASSFQRAAKLVCPVCKGERWVCAEHPDKPWRHDGCGWEGSPCVCNPKAEVEWAEVYAQVERPGNERLQ